MPRRPVTNRSCNNAQCTLHGQFGKGNIVRHGLFRRKRGRRRRYRCTACDRTFCSTTGTPYHRLQHSRNTFDEVAQMAVDGLSIAASARVKRIAWNTVAQWRQRAADAAGAFNNQMTQGYELRELQADEIRTFLDGKRQSVWVMATIEVWSRLWPACVVGRRRYRNTARLFRETIRGGFFEHLPLISTDGFQFYAPVMYRLFGTACVHGQVMKQWASTRVTRVDRKVITGSRQALDAALSRSEDSTDLNTSFIERLNLTIRQCSAYLSRRSPCHARVEEHLANHLELLRCYYNFVRPHRALKYGTETRTPAMQAGLASRRLSFRQIFMATLLFVLICLDFESEEARIQESKWAA